MSFDRRFFLKAIGTIGLASTLKTTIAKTGEIENNSFQFEALPYLQNFTQETVTIFAIFNRPCLAWVEIIQPDGNISQTFYQTEDGMRNANSEVFMFKIPHSGKNFPYRVVAKEVTRFDPYKIEYGENLKSPNVQTQLPFASDDATAHVLVLNDIHEDANSYGLLYNKSTLPKKDLILLNGDMFHYVTKQQDLTSKMLSPLSNLFAAHTPFVMIRGNHETRGSFARSYKDYFDYPQHKFYHAFSLGSTFWIVLDGGEDKPDSHEVYAQTVDYDSYRLEQREWLRNVLQSKERKKAKRTVVVTHIPFFHSDEWHGTRHNRECFHDLLQKNKVTAVISGHTHTYGFYPPDQNHNYYIIIGGGPKEGHRTFVEVTSSKRQFSLLLKKEDGEIIGRI